MLILPVAEAPNGAADARRLLLEVADQRTKVSIVVFGDDAHRRQIASRADVRADGHPFRRVVWIPDPSVLAGDETFSVLARAAANQDEAVAMTLQFRVSSRLRGGAAISFIELERAFARALEGMEEP